MYPGDAPLTPEFRDARTGATVTVKSRSSTILTVLWVLAILSVVGVLVLAGLTFYNLTGNPDFELVADGGIVATVIMLVVTIVNVRVLGFLRTKTDMNVEHAAVMTTGGEIVDLWKDRSVWITVGMVVSSLILVVSLASVFLFASAEFSAFPPIFWIAVSILVAPTLLILNFLRAKVMMKPEQIALQSLSGVTVTLRKKTSVWLTLAMVVWVLVGVGLLAIAALALMVSVWPEEMITAILGEEMSLMLSDSFQLYPVVITALFLLGGVGAFVGVAIFSHVRKRVFLS